MATFYGANAPFRGGKEKVMSRQVDERLIKNDLLQLLLTAPGERVMRPEFGAGLRNFVMQPLTTIDLDDLRSDLLNAIGRFERRVNVTKIDLQAKDNLLDIKIYGTINLDQFKNKTGSLGDGSLLVELNIPTGGQV
jgi:phage baseplate assembly protein W